jgi:hypothetical protein
VFVSSGVSGGALGVATFTALIADNNLPCADSSLPNARILHCADRFLAGDFLSPLLGAMLYPDLAQRFAPNLVPWFGKRADRARALEVAWEHQWQDVTNNSRFAEPFADLWSSDTSAIQVPAMFFTGTSVETGKRIIVGAPFGIRFFDSTDWLDRSSGPIALSTAVHMSARFTYFSPAGLLAHGHVVDGGYFDNSGATTALELLQAVMDSLRQDAQPIKPVVIMIENGLESDTVQTFAWLSEVLSPINAVVNARTARASLAKRVLRSEVQAKGGQYLRFALDCHSKPGLKLPLGWTLSALDRVTMLERLDMGCDGGVDNSASRDSVGSLLHPQSNQTPSGDH